MGCVRKTPYPWRIIQHLLLPQQCELCGRITVNRDLSPVCPDCIEGLKPLPEPVCSVCGIPLPGGTFSPVDTCSKCREDPPPFDMARAWGPYQGGLRTLLRAYKFQGLRPLSSPLATLLMSIMEHHFPESYDGIMPIPLHKKRLAERGYDQALLLARKLSALTGIPVIEGATRVKETSPQHGLSSSRRKSNLAGAFSMGKGLNLQGKRILVLDDVFTTGATVSAFCTCLRKKSEIDFIGVLTVARAIRHGPGN